MSKYMTSIRTTRRELLATTMLATLALSPVILAPRALAQTADQPPAASGGVTSLPPVDVNGEGSEAPGNSVGGSGLGGRFTGYTVDIESPAVATKCDIPILQTPSSIQVVPRQLIDDQQAISVQDAIVGNVSGVQPSNDPYYDSFTIRGFQNPSIFRNDLLGPDLVHIETANLQSIEILKGPAAMLFGRLEPGGIVNLVVKRPLEAPYYSIQEQAGSWGLTRTTVDASGPLTEDKTWLYRINLDFTHADSFRDFVTTQDGFVAPTITYHPIEQFRFNLDGEYQNRIFVGDLTQGSGIPAIGNRPANIPISRYLQDPALTATNPSRLQMGFIGYDWTFDITKDWSVTNRFSYYDLSYAERLAYYDSVDELTGFIQRGDWDINAHRTYLGSNLDLKGKFETGPFNHDVLIGTDYFTETNHDVGVSGDTPTVGPINMFFPTYSFTGYIKPPNNFNYAFQQSWEGVYAQDMISFADDKLHLLIGGRYDWAEYGNGFSPTSFNEATGPFDPATGNGFQNSFDKAFSPRVGAVVQPTPWLSFYGDYVKSFGATNGLPIPGQQPFAPEIATQWEGGAKAEFFDKRLTATVAFYDIVKTNIVQSIPGTVFSTIAGVVESKGAEFDIAGRIDENWSLIGSYSFDDARFTQSVIGNQGDRLQNVPLNSGNIWVKYDVLGDFRGLSLGGGLNIVGARQGDNANDFQLPAYTLVNAMVMYRLQPNVLPSWVKNATVQLNVKNLFNTIYYTASADRFSIYPGAPRTFLASLRAEF
jgi:iron complex outermembrane receptor protein